MNKHKHIKLINDTFKDARNEILASIKASKTSTSRVLRTEVKDAWNTWRKAKQTFRACDNETGYRHLNQLRTELYRIKVESKSAKLDEVIRYVNSWCDHNSNLETTSGVLEIPEPIPVEPDSPKTDFNPHIPIDCQKIKDMINNLTMSVEPIDEKGYAVVFKDTMGLEHIRLEHTFHKYSKGLYTFNSVEVR